MESLIKAAVVDDSSEDARQLAGYLAKYETEHDVSIQTTVFQAGFDFLEEYRGEYDVIFLDIEMPGSNGLEVAREIRSKDDAVGIIFVTSMVQYAIQGYEVNAINFMVKPMGYYSFSTKLEKALRFFHMRSTHDIIIHNKDGIRKILSSDIFYIEKERDNLVFHTRQGNFCERGSIKMLKEEFSGLPFAECTSGCLVNLKYVKYVGKDKVSLADTVELPLSRRLKQHFSREYISYAGGGF